ncbi:MAG TPA: N-acetylmuramoyl-L-alanine amidase [Candidatus Acidoferrales bacterium]|nr:N-acetylmuramoyl-L-alanine amidase [Candidatus Acidoferrales bacterium]
MTRARTRQIQPAIFAFLLAGSLFVCLAAATRADQRADAHDQFERAVQMRTQLEGYLPKDRALDDYKRTIAAYHKVYLISAQAVEVTPSLMAEAELYEEMGKQFDAKYFQSAIESYAFLIKQYPTSQYRGEAQLAIARIQAADQHKTDAALATYKDYLKRFPHSEKASEVRQEMKQVSATPLPVAQPGTEMIGPVVQPRVADNRVPFVKAIKTWNAENYTRVVVTLDDTVKYDVSHITHPDRIYFDIYKARIDNTLAHKTITVDDGLLKSVRVAQNKEGVVRIVLDVNGAKDYSAYLVKNPYRLVIDVRSGAPAQVAKNEAANSVVPPAAASEKRVSPASETVAVNANDPAPVDSKPSAKGTAKAPLPFPMSKKNANDVASLRAPAQPKPNRDGSHTLTRALGLKISRIVIDPGHGGHDTGTIGPHGLMEKDLCLDVALRLGRLIEQKLPGAEVIYTRKDDTFIPLEERTIIANEAKADLFISIHANSSPDHAARGVETYYLNFATSPDAMEVATRENALSQEPVHDLQDLIKKIARNDKIEESKELANDIQNALSQRLQLVSHSERNRGVKKAPFIVLIGANMPSVLSEISFVSNPSDEKLLRKADQRQRIADGLYRGISTYLESLNSLSYNKKPPAVADSDPASRTVAQDGNPK